MSASEPRRYRHLKRGWEYEIIAYASLQAAGPIEEGQLLTIYQGGDGRIWARPSSEFCDGRFEPVEDGGRR